jgi:LysM repeat protein
MGIIFDKLAETNSMNKFLIALFLAFTTAFSAQPDKASKEFINGTKYYVHVVKPGNTVWWIHENYDVPVEEITKANPGSEKGVSVGQKVLVPVPRQTVNYTVASKETLFSIAKKFEVSMDAIVLSNPGVENGVQTGQILKIENVDREVATRFKEPQSISNSTAQISQVVFTQEAPKVDTVPLKKADPVKIPLSDTLISYTVREGETLYTVSKRYMVSVEELQKVNQLKSSRVRPGDILKIQVKKQEIKNIEVRGVEPLKSRNIDSVILFPKKSIYKIALLLPFNLDSDNPSDHISDLATEFYMGAKLAIDSLKKMGFNAEIFVHDLKNDTLRTKKILASADFKDIDLIFGPFFPENAAVVARWCKVNHVRMICPTTVPSSITRGNPYVYSTVPSDVQLQEYLGEYLANVRVKDQIILVKPTGEKDALSSDAFRRSFNSVTGHSKLFEATLETYSTLIKKGIPTVLVFPSNDKGQIIKFMNSVNANSSKMLSEDIIICGTKEWMAMDEVKAHFREKYHFQFPSPNDLNYSVDLTKNVLRQFRATYNTDLSKMASQGFDVIFHGCSVLLQGNEPGPLLMNEFLFEQKTISDGFQNRKAFILEQREYELETIAW